MSSSLLKDAMVQFLPKCIVSSVLATALGYSVNPDFSVSFLAFTFMLSSAALDVMFLTLVPAWSSNGMMPESALLKTFNPVGRVSYVLFYLGVIFTFASYAVRQTATASLVIGSIIFSLVMLMFSYHSWVYLNAVMTNQTDGNTNNNDGNA